MGFWGVVSSLISEFVLVTAARSLQMNEPASKLAGWLSWAMLGEQPVSLPESGQILLLLPPYLLRKIIPDEAGQVLVDGLSESAMSFWGYRLTKMAKEASVVLKLVLRHGDDKTKLVARGILRATLGR